MSHVTYDRQSGFGVKNPTTRRPHVQLGMASRFVSFISMITTLACSSNAVSGPRDGRLVSNADGRATLASGLEQRVTIKVEAAPAGSPYAAILTATSTLVNTGTSPVPVTSRVCFFQEADFESTARLDRFEPLISCAAVTMTSTLAPGQSTGALDAQFGVRSSSGTYTLKLRHSLAPEFRAEVSFRVL